MGEGRFADRDIDRRAMLRSMAVAGAGAALAGCGVLRGVPHGPGRPRRLRAPGSRPNPRLPEGVDTLPQIEHIVVLMMENHSFDDHFGLLGRGDGFRLDRHGRPRDANPDGTGRLIRAFHMPSTCQLHALPGQDWDRSHTAWDDGRNDGFVRASGPVAMGYWDGTDLPFYYGLGRTFPVCDRWFSSVLAQTYPNRRFLMAGTAAGIVSTTSAALTAPPPPNGTIFDRFHAHGITWKNYFTDLPSAAIILDTLAKYGSNLVPIAQYFADAAAGTLPSFCIVDPNFDTQSEENPQDVRAGEQVAAKVIDAAMQGPAWPKTLVIWTYDEHGGYYDHVPPPPAVAPDAIPPDIHVPPDLPGGYDRYGFRVPAVIVSPFARRHYVSHRVHDHTSVLKLVETKWNLGAMTYRDANADDLLDSLDLDGRPAFLDPPVLPAPAPAPASVAAKPSAGCRASVHVPPGEEKVTIDSGGTSRWFFRHVPPSYTGTTPVPVVVDIHGYAEGAAIHEKMTGLGRYGDAHGFVTITPQGQGPIARWDTTLGGADLRFIGDALDQVDRTLCVDDRRVFVTGLSNGAFMTSAVACEYADRIAAVAPVAGIQDIAGCAPARPVPVVAFHGTADPFVAYTGGLGPKALQLPAPDGSGRTLGQSGVAVDLTKGPSVPEITAAWAKRNRCASKPSERSVAADVTLIGYDCPSGADVELYRITGGGHSWPGSAFSRAIVATVGPTTFAISADDVVWRFFTAHPLAG